MTRRSRSLRFERLEDRQNPTPLVPQFVPDASFGTDGFAFVDAELGPLYAQTLDAELDAQGRVWILGSVAGNSIVARFLPDGKLDSTFGGDGVQTLAPWTEEITSLNLVKLAILPDGDAIVGGQAIRGSYWPYVFADKSAPSLTVPAYPHNDFVAIRLNADGSLDAGFGDGGRAVVDIDGDGVQSSANLLAMTVLDTGRIAIGLDVSSYYAIPAATTGDAAIPPPFLPPRVALARLTADGKLDATYDGDGIVSVPTRGTPHETVWAISLRGNGDATMLGVRNEADSNRSFVTAYRFTADGQPDAGFDGDGYAEYELAVAVPFPEGTSGVSAYGGWNASRPDGSELFGTILYRSQFRNGTYYSKSTSELIAVRIRDDGSLDGTFGTGGRLVRPVSEFSSESNPTPTVSKTVVGLKGFADGSFAVLETATSPYPILPAATETSPIYAPPIVATAMARYDSSGRPLGDLLRGSDFTFPTTNSPGRNIQPREVFFDADGNLLAVGATDSSTVTGTRLAVARFLPTTAPENPVEQTILVSRGNGEVIAVQVDATNPAVIGSPSRPFGAFGGPVQARLADLDGDGTPDDVYGIGAGGGSTVRAFFRNADGTIDSRDLTAFEDAFRGGVSIETGDLDGDGTAEVIVSAGNGGGGRVQIYSLTRSGPVKRADFFGIDDANFRGGATAAIADLDGDGKPELLVAAGVGGGPRVAVFDGESLFSTAVGLAPPKLRNDFFAFGGVDADRMRNGVNVSAADLNGDDRIDLIFGAGVGGARRVLGIDGGRFLAGSMEPVVNFFVANDDASREGVTVSVKDIDQDDRPDLVVEQGSQLRIYDGDQLAGGNGQEPGVLRDVIIAPYGEDGIFVG